MDKSPRFVVVCDDWPAERAEQHKTRASAERHLADVTKLGACKLSHRIQEVPR